MNKTQDFTKGVIWKQLLFFFFPILIGSFFQQLYNTVDTIIVGQACGTNALAAVGSTGSLNFLIIGFVLGLLLHYLIYVKIIVTHFGGTWKVPVVPMEIIVLLVLVSCILAVYAPAKRIRNMAITATINEL